MSKVYRLKVLAGSHREPTKKKIIGGKKAQGTTFFRGDVFETTDPLHLTFRNKFRLHHGPIPAKKEPPPDPRKELQRQDLESKKAKPWSEPALSEEEFEEEGEGLTEEEDIPTGSEHEDETIPEERERKKKKKKKKKSSPTE